MPQSISYSALLNASITAGDEDAGWGPKGKTSSSAVGECCELPGSPELYHSFENYLLIQYLFLYTHDMT